jgi:hypothetical protein
VGLDAICLSSKSLFSLRDWLRRTRLTDCLDGAHPQKGFFAARDTDPPDGHFVPYVLGESFRGEAIRLQIGNPAQTAVVDQDVSALLFIYTPGHGSSLPFFFFRWLLLLLG